MCWWYVVHVSALFRGKEGLCEGLITSAVKQSQM